MFWSDPTSRFSLTLRRLRTRFGWKSPGVTVRMALPWHWRAVAVVVLSSISLALAGWIYDTGRSLAGAHEVEKNDELTGLRERVAGLEIELAKARELANTSVSQLQMEATTQDRLTQQVKGLADENIRLKADLAMFENFVGGDSGIPGLAITRLSVEPGGEPGKYAYRLLVTQQGKGKEREFKGRLQLAITARRNGKPVTIDYPLSNAADSENFSVSFKSFRRLDGIFNIPSDLKLESVEARLVESGTIRARQTLNL